MQKTKKTYEKPVLHAEQFIPNEYVAACWYIACSLGTNDCYVKDDADYNNESFNHTGENSNGYIWSKATKDANGSKHSRNSNGTGCGWATNQHIYQNADGSFSITEENVPEGSTLVCTITSPSPLKEISDGLTVKWTTSNGSTTWLHEGTVSLTAQNRPLHS